MQPVSLSSLDDFKEKRHDLAWFDEKYWYILYNSNNKEIKIN